MLLAAAAILCGFVVLVWSADQFVAGAAAIAKNLGTPPIVIGLTIVSLGTSAPELLVSTTASLTGAGELAIGNAIGSNIANIALILGITLLVAPLMVDSRCMNAEIPLLLLATFGVGLLLLDYELSRTDGLLMITLLTLVGGWLLMKQLRQPAMFPNPEEDSTPPLAPGRAWFSFMTGLVFLVVSSRLLVWGAVQLALEIGVSELVIGLTIIAIGTSLPELAASIASALRGHTEIALGNIIGSNLVNLLAVMAIPGIVASRPLDALVLHRDYFFMAFLTVFLAIAIQTSRRRSKSSPGHAYLGRVLGALLVSLYGLYYYLLHTTR